jgi:hypothetical protein
MVRLKLFFIIYGDHAIVLTTSSEWHLDVGV